MQKTFKSQITFLLLSFCTLTIGQNYKGEIVNIKNETLPVEIILDASSFNVNRLIKLQDKITVIQNGTKLEYLPKDLKTFKIELEKETITFESVDEAIFAQGLYSNKVKLYKILKQISHGHIVRYYVIKKPNINNLAQMPAMGLSRLIKKDAMLPAIEDCKISYDKVKNDEIKIKDEKILIDFIKDYESNCFQN
ncbi:hypothetical protein ACFFLS_10585 [Flavobacterium procerum]|uniref:Uncharacterized protein n=1 Tax=Flavobacterium procerum TaxID=1455569 RepID=A0ABV6BTV9_9FLAO